ncbi:hypothetical protein J6X13_01695 [Candidatus Saccharibacteria bacterium]|nr:hypothetical protein [Candidatus Saccharibacteria bacterium]
MAEQLSIRRIKKMSKDDIFAIPIVDTKLSPSVKTRLSDYLSFESDRVFAPEEATIEDLVRSPHGLDQMFSHDSKYHERMFSNAICEKIIWTLWSIYRIDYNTEHKRNREEQILMLPIRHTLFTPYTKKHLSGFLSFASGGKTSPEDATIEDLLHCAYNLEEMNAYEEGSVRKLFSPNAREKIIAKLKGEYDIDYRSEREKFLAKHTGLDTFIFRAGLPNGRHLILLQRMGNYNATIRDLLDAPFDFRAMPRFGNSTQQFILQYFEAEGIDYETSRRK